MLFDERKELIKVLKNHTANKSGINLSALSDAELRQQAQKILSAEAIKKIIATKKKTEKYFQRKK